MTQEDIIDLIKETGKVENNDNILEYSLCDNLTITETVKEEVPNVEHCKSLLELWRTTENKIWKTKIQISNAFTSIFSPNPKPTNQCKSINATHIPNHQ